MSDIISKDVFHFDGQRSFENFSHENDVLYWYASDLAEFLGYDNFKSFETGPLNRAMTALNSLNIPIYENITQFIKTTGNKDVVDYKLTRFACYIIAMNGNVKKPQVAKAQAYFAALAESFQRVLQAADNVERVAIRDDVGEISKTLSATAKTAGVESYGLFLNEGYRGMYNMNLKTLLKKKGVPKGRTPFDFMGKTELAANLFRVTQTESKIKADNIQGQKPLEAVAFHVGKKVRNTMIDISGIAPENLPPAEDIKTVHKELKQTHRGFKKLDTTKKETIIKQNKKRLIKKD